MDCRQNKGLRAEGLEPRRLLAVEAATLPEAPAAIDYGHDEVQACFAEDVAKHPMTRISFTLLLATAILISAEQARSDTIFTTVGGGALGKVDTTDSNLGTVIGPPGLPPAQPPALLTGLVSAAFNADGTKIYTLINTLAETEEHVSSQLGVIEDINNGTITPIGEIHPFNIVAMEVDSENNILATGFDLNPGPSAPLNWFGDSKLYNIDKQTGALTEIGETGIDEPIMDLAIDGKGKVWATTRNKLWTLNTKNGQSKFEVDISGIPDDGGGPVPAEIMGLFFDASDQLLGTDVLTGDLYKIDTKTGAAKFLKETGWGFRNDFQFAHGGDIFVPPPLQAGDSDQDYDFDQLDLVQVRVAAKYLTGQPATWGEGDWDGAPGGSPGDPPSGNGRFDQFDIIAAQQGAKYLAGPYAAIQPNGKSGDGQTSVVYNSVSGEVSVDAPAGIELTSINIDSAVGIFTGRAAQNLGGSFDNDADGNIFKATFGSSFGSVSFGNVAQAGLSEEFVLGDLTVVGSLAGGGDLGEVDLVYVPEPTSALLITLGVVAGLLRFRRVGR